MNVVHLLLQMIFDSDMYGIFNLVYQNQNPPSTDRLLDLFHTFKLPFSTQRYDTSYPLVWYYTDKSQLYSDKLEINPCVIFVNHFELNKRQSYSYTTSEYGVT